MEHRTFALAAGCAAVLVASPVAAQRPGVYLGDLTWPEAERRLQEAPLVVLPFGAGAKEHGPHLPLNADRVVMDWLLAQAVDSLPIVVAPPILHGWFPAFRDFPGTEVTDADLFGRYVYEVAHSLVEHGARRIVFLNTGIANATGLPIAIAAREIRTRTGTPTLVVSWDDLETPEFETFTGQAGGGHADEMETSIHLYLQPDLVRTDRIPGAAPADTAGNYPGYQPGLLSRDPRDPAYSPEGYTGDPSLATAEKGERALRIMRTQWLRALRGFAASPTRD